ncbi:ABC transporter permease [Hymenobacter crusticola]|uniref:ABC transporter permease n=1 Tax=Hymenobacter crusticola TaxID=1770526 RepID=A0A243WC29_9BACT|nr:ABC transporter permease [Hymenobacter crusticola]OUJ73179.1 ABC transporter permease [Hymenobacter crusticola]
MNYKFWLIAQREYLTRVRKKSFVVLTVLVPLLMAGVFAFVAKLAKSDDNKVDVIEVRDDTNLGLTSRLPTTEQLLFLPAAGSLAEAKQSFQKSKHDGLLYLPPNLDVQNPQGIQLFAKGNVSMRKQRAVENALNKTLSDLKMQQSGLTQEQLDRLRSKVLLTTVALDEQGQEKSSDTMATTAAAYALALLIYMFIFIYGVQIMRGVGEEKSNRIMEVMLSSVKPFDLMMGKIVGIAAVGLTQFLLWGVLSFGASSLVGSAVFGGNNAQPVATAATRSATSAETDNKQTAQANAANTRPETAMMSGRSAIFDALGDLPIGMIMGGFLIYFLGGYLLYGALFGAIGAAVDDQTDTQQFMFPVTIPLILSYIIGVSVILRNPDGPIAFWMSMIPFTSPIAMVIRLPFGVPLWQLGLSVALLIAGFIGTVWLAARIYRVGVLMYGKKVTYRELGKWMFYKG